MFKIGDQVEFIYKFEGWEGSIMEVIELKGNYIRCKVLKPTKALKENGSYPGNYEKNFMELLAYFKMYKPKEPLTYGRAIEILKGKNVQN